MPDEFDRFLALSLAPPERLPDRRFVAAVQARIVVEQRLARERRALVGGLVRQLVAVAAVAAGVALVGRAPRIDTIAADSPALAVLILIVGFALFVALVTARGAADSTSSRYFRGLTN